MGTNTTNYSFSKPTVDGDEDSWGTQLNGNWDKTDSLLSGGQDISSLSITTSVTLKGQADLVLKDADSSHSVSLQAPATIGTNFTLTLPAADGSSGQVIQTDGSGNLSFVDQSGGGGSGDSIADADGDTKIQVEEGTDDDTIRFDTAGSERLIITPTGNVGINTTTPYDSQWGTDGNNTELAIEGGSTGYGVIHLRGTGAGSTDTRFSMGVGDTKFYMAYDRIAGTHRMVMDVNGNLLVGKTSANSNTTGVQILGAGDVGITRDGSHSLLLNRQTSDGDIALFRKDGTTIGSLGVVATNNLYLTNPADGIGLGIGDDNLYPVNGTGGANGSAVDIGDSTVKFRNLYLSGSTTADSGFVTGHASLSHQTDNTWRGLTITNTGDNNECTVDGKSSDGTQQFIVYGGAQAQGFLNPSTYGWRLKIPLSGSFSRDNTHTIWDSGNDGSGSGLDADLLDGLQLHTGRNNEANKVVRSNSSGYVDFGWINTTSGSTGSNGIDRVYSSYDGYIRYSSATNFLHKQGLSYYRAYNWIEWRGTGAGLYWSNSTGAGWHIYPANTSTMRHRSGATTCSIRMNTNGTDRNYIYQNSSNEIGFLTSGGGWLFRCYNNGNVTATGNVTAYSDIRLKTDIEPIKDALDKVTNLEGIEYTRKSTGEREIGFVAQNVKEVVPELVDVIDASTEEQEALPDLHVMKYQNTTALLVEAVKELKAEVDTLRQEIAELKKEG